MKKKIAITVLAALVLCVIGIIVYQNANKELLIGCYYNSEDDGSYLEIREDGTFDFRVRIYLSRTVMGTYEIEDKYLILTTTYGEEIKFEIGYKQLRVIESEVFEDYLPEGRNYKWNEGTIVSMFEQRFGE